MTSDWIMFGAGMLSGFVAAGFFIVTALALVKITNDGTVTRRLPKIPEAFLLTMRRCAT